MALAIGLAVVLMAPSPIAGQAQNSQAKAAAPAAAAKPWTGKTPDGYPDLQGYWTNNSYTPLQRPANVTKEFYTPEELKEVEKRSAEREAAQTEPGTTADVHYDFTQFGLDRSQTRLSDNLRTSIIVDPPNGQLPPRVGAAAAGGGGGGGRGGRGGGGAAPAAAGGRGAGAAAAAPGGGARGGQYDQVQNVNIGTRCIWSGNTGPPMMPPGYNPAYQIVQSKDTVMILIENQHEIRIIPVDNKQHNPQGVREWLGDSVGHYEGNTLVVETTNFNSRTAYQGSSPDMKVTERFTRLTDDTIKYEFTVDDPKTWTQPWKGEMPFVKINGPIFEHACHEGNFGLANTMNAVRLEEKKAAEAAAKQGK